MTATERLLVILLAVAGGIVAYSEWIAPLM